MIDQHLDLAILTFALGFLFGYFVQSWRVQRWQRRLSEYLPYRCPSCRTWHIKRNVRFAEHRTAGWIFICKRCYDEQYHPFRKEQS